MSRAMPKPRERQRRANWRWIFGERGAPVAIIEQQRDQLFHIIVAGKDLGSFGSMRAAEEFARLVTAAGADRTRRG